MQLSKSVCLSLVCVCERERVKERESNMCKHLALSETLLSLRAETPSTGASIDPSPHWFYGSLRVFIVMPAHFFSHP